MVMFVIQKTIGLLLLVLSFQKFLKSVFMTKWSSFCTLMCCSMALSPVMVVIQLSSINQSYQSKHISIAPYIASESEAHDDRN